MALTWLGLPTKLPAKKFKHRRKNKCKNEIKKEANIAQSVFFFFDILIATTMEEGELKPQSLHIGEQAMPLSYKAVGFAQSF